MRKLIAFLLAAALVLSLAACGSTNDTSSGGSQSTESSSSESGSQSSSEEVSSSSEQASSNGEENPEASESEPQGSVMSTNNFAVDAICVDNSYVDSEGGPLKLVYLFYTLTADNENLYASSVGTYITINDANTYLSEMLAHEPTAHKFISNYIYDNTVEDVYIGTSAKFMETFKIPEGDLAAGRTIRLSNDNIPGIDEILLSTDDIQQFNSAEELAQTVDPDGYAEAQRLREEADPETTARVKGLINGKTWSIYTATGTISNGYTSEIEFWADNNFEFRTIIGSKSGTYSVRNGFIYCIYPETTEPSLVIPYEFTDTEDGIDLDLGTAIDNSGAEVTD